MEAEDIEENNVRCLFANSQLLVTDLPDSILLHILQYLPFSSICQVGKVCRRWNQVSSDELLWRSVFLWHFKLPFTTSLPKKAESWRSEFKRLFYHTPALLVEELKEHKDEVLHVSFSHDGTMFATCSKDGYFMIWSTQSNPVRLLFKMDMKSRFSWHFTQFSQFNESDTCLLVSGVYRGSFTTSGEIAIFNLQDNYEMQSRVTNKPYDVFGAWYDNDHLLSGTIYTTGRLSSVSAIWLSKASQEVESEVESVSMVLYRFQNNNSSSVRLINVAEIEKATAVYEDSEGFAGTEQRLPCNCSSPCGDSTEPSLLDKLLCKEISEEEFDIENEDCDDYDDEEEEDECDEDDETEEDGCEEEPQDIAIKPEDVLVESLEASESMEWMAVGGNADDEYLRTTEKTRAESCCSGDNQAQCDDTLFWHNLQAFCVNACDSHTNDPSNISNAQIVNSSNNASTVLSENVPYSSFNLAAYPSFPQRCENASNNYDEKLSLNVATSDWIVQQTKHNSDNSCLNECSVGPSSSTNLTGDYSQASTASLRQTSTTQNPSHCLDMLATQQEVDCVQNSELCSQDLQNFRGDEDETFPAKIPSEHKERGIHWSPERMVRFPGNSSTCGDSSNAIINSAFVMHQIDEDNKESDIQIDLVDGSQNSCLSLSRAAEHLQSGDCTLPTSSSSGGEKIQTKDADHEHKSVTGLVHDSSCHLGSKHVTRQQNEHSISENEQASSLSKPSTSCDEPPHSSSFSSPVLCEKIRIRVTPRAPQPFAAKDAGCSISSASKSNLPTTENICHGGQNHKKKSKASQTSFSQRQERRCKRPPEKLLIYTWGTKTFTPHMIGIKRMKWTDFNKGEVTARRASMLPCVMESLQNGTEPTRRDEPDHSIDMHGHIVGLRVAPDQRYLYVNCRPWPQNYIISDPHASPPLAQEVEISTIDLQTFEFVGPVLRSHKAFTHSDDCFFLSVDVSEDFVVSGAEDKQGYLWDRHYAIPLYRFPHSNVVNCVAVNPKDPEMLVTVSDDFSIKVWASRHKSTGSRQQSHSITEDGGKS